LQCRGDGRHLSCLPCQQSAALSKDGLAFVLVAFFVATIIIAAATAADALAVAIGIAVAIAVAVATALPLLPLLTLPSPSPSPLLPKRDIC
jgi:hypothetical protein